MFPLRGKRYANCIIPLFKETCLRISNLGIGGDIVETLSQIIHTNITKKQVFIHLHGYNYSGFSNLLH